MLIQMLEIEVREDGPRSQRVAGWVSQTGSGLEEKRDAMSTWGAVKKKVLSLFSVPVLPTTSLVAADPTQKLARDGVVSSMGDSNHHAVPIHVTGSTIVAESGWWDKTIRGSLLLFGVALVFGCTTVVTPLQPGDRTSFTKGDHGLVLGRVHLMWNGKDQRTGVRLPFDVRWRITEEQSGTQLVINHVPLDGPFVLDLPAGSYRLTHISLDNSLGIWQTSLPASFSVQPQECTYLGTWELTMQTDFFSGSITRQVIDQRDLAQRDLQATISDDHTWRPMVAQLVASMQSPLVLTFRTQGTELTSPP